MGRLQRNNYEYVKLLLETNWKDYVNGLWVCVNVDKEYCTTVFCFTHHTCKQKQDSVVSVVNNVDPLDRQMAVVVLRGHHG